MRLAWVLVWVALAAGCGGDGAPGTPGDDAGPSPADADTAAPEPELPEVPTALGYAPCLAATRVGGFQITLADDYTGADGQIYDGVVPANVPDEVQVDGACRLLRARSLFCEPGCVPGETCGEEGACIPYPERSSVGLVTVTGLKEALAMEAKWGNTYTNPGSMIHPGYEVGADIGLAAAGGDFEPFSLRGFGVEGLVLAGPGQVVVEPGQSIDLSWEAPTVEGPAKVRVELNVNNHGSTSAWLACDVADTGSFSVPAALLDALQDIGISGFPSLSLTRRSVDSAVIGPGCVDLRVASERTLGVEIAGQKSCTSDQQCPPGQDCGVDLACH